MWNSTNSLFSYALSVCVRILVAKICGNYVYKMSIFYICEYTNGNEEYSCSDYVFTYLYIFP